MMWLARPVRAVMRAMMGSSAVRAVGTAPASWAMMWLAWSVRAVMGAWAMRAVGATPASMAMVRLSRPARGCDEGP